MRTAAGPVGLVHAAPTARHWETMCTRIEDGHGDTIWLAMNSTARARGDARRAAEGVRQWRAPSTAYVRCSPATPSLPWPSPQGELFHHEPTQVQALIDTVRNRFGARAIALGDSVDRWGRYTGVKIAFEHIPAVAEFEWLGIEVPKVGKAP